MAESGPGLSQIERNNAMIVKTRRSWFREVIIVILTAVAWLYCLGVIYFFVDSLFGLDHRIPRLIRGYFQTDSDDVRKFVFFVALMYVLIFMMLLTWSIYNKRKFGGLKRRKYPPQTTDQEILALGMMDKDVFEKIKTAKRTQFQNNPIRRK